VPGLFDKEGSLSPVVIIARRLFESKIRSVFFDQKTDISVPHETAALSGNYDDIRSLICYPLSYQVFCLRNALVIELQRNCMS